MQTLKCKLNRPVLLQSEAELGEWRRCVYVVFMRGILAGWGGGRGGRGASGPADALGARGVREERGKCSLLCILGFTDKLEMFP